MIDFSDRHLANITEPGRERECLNRMFELYPHGEAFWASLGAGGMLGWIGINIPMQALYPSDAREAIEGEVDVFVAPMHLDVHPDSPAGQQRILESQELFTWSRVAGNSPGAFAAALLRAGWLTWPPIVDPTGAAEVKAPYLTARGELKASRSGRKAKSREQARRLLDAGFPRAGFVQMVPIEADPNRGGNPYLAAGALAFEALDLAQESCVTRAGDAVAEWIWLIGAVVGKLENEAGGGGPHLIRQASSRSPSQDQARRLSRMSAHLQASLGRWPPPEYAPAFILTCESGCGALFHARSPRAAACPACCTSAAPSPGEAGLHHGRG